jgi:hypothetical protein
MCDERTSLHYFMRFCNFRRFSGNFAGQINSILGKLCLHVARRWCCLWLCLKRERFVRSREPTEPALASRRFFGYDSRVA